MHGRAASINGKLQIKSAQSKGTRVSVSVKTSNQADEGYNSSTKKV
jgi:nitrate/nitrite-specific signal transduction histidine kinase